MNTLTRIKPSDDPRERRDARDDDTLRPITSRALFDGRRELRIVHGDAVYRLRITRNDKLILTK